MNTRIFKVCASVGVCLFFLTAARTCIVTVGPEDEPRAWDHEARAYEEPPQAGGVVPPKLLVVGGPYPAPMPIEGPTPTEAAFAEQQEWPAEPGEANEGLFANFVTVLQAGTWQKRVLGPAAFDGGYVVDVTPLERSVDGAHVEHKVLPEFDGEQWNDVLWMILPEPADPLRVRVRVYVTSGWPVVFRERLVLQPGEWQGYILCEVAPQGCCATENGGYVIEINPLGPAQPGDTVEKTLVQPERTWETWYDVLRVQIPAGQEALEAEVRVYRTPPHLRVAAEYDIHLQPGIWYGSLVGPARLNAAYVMEVTPTGEGGGWIDRYTVQPEFNGQTWNDVARLSTPEGWPEMDVHVRVYAVEN